MLQKGKPMNDKYFKGILRFPRRQRAVAKSESVLVYDINTHTVEVLDEVACTTTDEGYQEYIRQYEAYLKGEIKYFPDPRD